jgi:hypothetical protein
VYQSPRPEGQKKKKPNTESNPDIPNDISQKHRLKDADKKKQTKKNQINQIKYKA